jgi:hypothetical protein
VRCATWFHCDGTTRPSGLSHRRGRGLPGVRFAQGRDGKVDHNWAMTGDDLRDFVNGKLFPSSARLHATR